VKKSKTITFQLQDEYEKDLFNYVSEQHNFSGFMKRIVGNSQGFQEWKEKQKRKVVPIIRSNSQNGIKIKLE
jgi:hypothetical protein